MTQLDIFDAVRSRRRKTHGMEVAAKHQNQLLEKAREVAKELATKDANRETTSDEVSQELSRRGFPDCLGPAAGSIFKTTDWEFSGKFINSTRVTNHSRLLRVWRLRA